MMFAASIVRPISDIFLIAFSAMMIVGAFYRDTRLRGAFNRTSPGVPISKAGRGILFATGVLLSIMAVTDLLQK